MVSEMEEGQHYNPILMISLILCLDSPFSSINSVCALLPPEICGRREGWKKEEGEDERKCACVCVWTRGDFLPYTHLHIFTR